MAAVYVFMGFATVLGVALLLVVAIGALRKPGRERPSRRPEKSTSRTPSAAMRTRETAPTGEGEGPRNPVNPVNSVGRGEGGVPLAS